VLELASSGVAGGRVGGLGRRNAARVCRFRLEEGVYTKTLDISDDSRLEDFELPFHASAVSLYTEDGTEEIVSGVVDPGRVAQYDAFFASM